jgi:predicted DNA-binding transcriptional regulator YafY
MIESAAARALRLIDLVPFLHNHPGISLKEVADQFNVTVPEMVKDLELLFMCGLPGYTPLELIDLSIEDGIVSLREPQNLDSPRRFSQTEALIIRVALAALEELLPNQKRAKVRELREKFTRLFTNDVPNQAIYFESDSERTKMKVISDAISQEKKLLITYINPTKSEVTERKISITKIVPESKRTLIESWCDSSNGIRTFNLANIKSINLIDEPSVRNISAGAAPIISAALRASDENVFLKENASQVQKRGDRYFVDVFQDEWLVRSALADGGELVVESPEGIRARIAFLAEESLKNYSKAD